MNLTLNPTYILAFLLCSVSGFTQCFLVVCAFYVLKQPIKYQFHRTFAAVVLVEALATFSYFLTIVCFDSPHAEYIGNILVLFDYIVIGCLFVFAASLVYPDRFSTTQLLLFGAPYVLAVALYAITQKVVIVHFVMIVTPIVSLLFAILFILSIKRHTKRLRDNTGDIEHYDMRWVLIVLMILFVIEIAWSVLNRLQYKLFAEYALNGLIVVNIAWCLFTMLYVSFITRKVVSFQIFEFPPEVELPAAQEDDKGDDNPAPNYYHALANIDIDTKMAKNKYYHDSTLTLQKLAFHLGTNRQYLSNYINKEKNKTFYEYINDYRLEEAKAILDGWGDNPQQSLEDVALTAGFNSYSTFFRSFVKKYDITPSKYIKMK